MKVACNCGIEMKNARTGMVWLERKEDGTPYQGWSCDKMECPDCGNVVYRLANSPMLHCAEKGFDANLHAAREVGILVEDVP